MPHDQVTDCKEFREDSLTQTVWEQRLLELLRRMEVVSE